MNAIFLFAENAFISWLGICNKLIENKILNLLNERLLALIEMAAFFLQSTKKSSLLTAAKKAKLKSNPNRVRFSENVTVTMVNGAPLQNVSCVCNNNGMQLIIIEELQIKSNDNRLARGFCRTFYSTVTNLLSKIKILLITLLTVRILTNVC